MLERAALLTDDQQEIKLRDLFPDVVAAEAISYREIFPSKSFNSQKIAELFTPDFSLEHYEQQIILQAMQQTQNNVSEAARILGISRATLDYRLKKYRALS